MKEDKEFIPFLLDSKRRFDHARDKFDYHSREFDRKVSKILANL